ncbi:MAG: hypothetical protein ACLT8C_04370 [Akkermansia muciniphila]
MTHFTGNGCWLSVGQAWTPESHRDSGTSGIPAHRTGNAEYHSGWPVMNLDYEKFIDSRFAMNIYKLAGAGSSPEEAADPPASQGIHADRHEDCAQSQPVLYGPGTPSSSRNPRTSWEPPRWWMK